MNIVKLAIRKKPIIRSTLNYALGEAVIIVIILIVPL